VQLALLRHPHMGLAQMEEPVRELDKIVAVRGRPGGIMSDNGTELTSTAILGGRIGKRLSGTTSPRANQSRTPSSKALTAGCATSC
jgi:hypothetical protein